ncbi:hypothetical protein JOC95_001693 [Bacillus tianshenii]|uniref:Uncharacterized protein n=1 Tax=Sutcliffiella tianshenii TaxID=1463404 RepID=A0ABS2NYS5_9BACI|nr:hypothetical protein [Bacillus tianshenii]
MGRLFRRVFIAVLPILAKEGYKYFKERKKTPRTQ